jgi:hypothetical protein
MAGRRAAAIFLSPENHQSGAPPSATILGLRFVCLSGRRFNPHTDNRHYLFVALVNVAQIAGFSWLLNTPLSNLATNSTPDQNWRKKVKADVILP